MAAHEYLIVLVLGFILGSFATALIYRIPRGIPWSHGSKSAYRSACPRCKTNLKVLDLIPVVSWLLVLRGKCRYCEAAISLQYPLTELGVVLACIGVYLVFGFTLEAFIIIAVVPFLAALLVIDLEDMILPNELVLITGVLAVVRLAGLIFDAAPSAVLGLAVDHAAGAFVYAGFVWIMSWAVSTLLKKEALGFGDIKFFFVAGLWLGLSNLAWFCMVAGFLGVVFGFSWQVLKKDRLFPFGPALISALYVLLLLDGSLLM